MSGHYATDGKPKNVAAVPADVTTANSQDDQAESKDPNTFLFVLLGVLYSTYFGSEGTLIPFLPVYYHSLGHGGNIIGVLGSVTPFTTFCVGPLWGMVSDHKGQTITFLFGTMFLAWSAN